jgi:hypothetical protein
VETEIRIEFNESAFRHGCTEKDIYRAFNTYYYDGDMMARMTEEAAAMLDKKWTENIPKVGANGTGFFARHRAAHLIPVDDLSADYLQTRAVAEQKTLTQVVNELIRERIRASA